ncbi:hypothetical protein O6H91_Y130800 [Diphasiastrum complanatum]|nr:hypothetical protein O6H91_Y130800 [Diphasiastrum complanatum]
MSNFQRNTRHAIYFITFNMSSFFFLAITIINSVHSLVFVSGSTGPIPCNSSYVSSCSSFLFYPYEVLNSSQQLATAFGVPDDSVVLVQTSGINGYFISVSCVCSSFSVQQGYAAMTTYTVKQNDTGLREISDTFFNHLAWVDQSNSNISAGEMIELPLLCGCSIPGWKYIVSYAVQAGDILSALAGSFHSDQDQIQMLSGITDPNTILVDQVIFVPINFVPSTLGILTTSPSPSPVPSPPGFSTAPTGKNHQSRGGVIVGLTVAVIVLAILGCTYFLCKRRAGSAKHNQRTFGASLSHDTELSRTAKRSSGLWASFRRNVSVNNNVKRNVVLRPEAMDMFDAEKPIVFDVEEIIAATGNFKEAKKIGQGGYGSVYFGILRNQEVAIKQMKATKSREFFAELKVLCKVHHSNLVELIGYSASEDYLFLVYEFAENGALSERLHDPVMKGHRPLSWTTRTQIALDAARGLEYIHEHTKTHYVHRDVKTSNILLDCNFRAKVADFGLAKLVEQVGDVTGATTNVVGTFGYIAPEYIRDGHATSKSDVYAFGVVLMELITGEEAIARSRSMALHSKGLERRSLVTLMMSVFDDKEPMSKLKGLIDSNLENNYPLDYVFKMAVIARSCVEEKAMSRPDMKSIVFSLSKILQSSVEYEAAMAGDSQVFSGISHGR